MSPSSSVKTEKSPFPVTLPEVIFITFLAIPNNSPGSGTNLPYLYVPASSLFTCGNTSSSVKSTTILWAETSAIVLFIFC